ncbi:unnamed protein product [Symbiodinium necroappetens]|uniref:Uncharacterized protein n=1 Tax=Symbiodinium necroappetens TaxID=1628268 RepID=A0A812WQA9_9DINO|nr:unnamed protein product [Symbiodinium necroappetens]
MPSEAEISGHAPGLRDFLKQVPEGRRLALLEDTYSLARATELTQDAKDFGAAKRLSSTGALVQHVAWIDQNGHSSHGNYSLRRFRVDWGRLNRWYVLTIG